MCGGCVIGCETGRLSFKPGLVIFLGKDYLLEMKFFALLLVMWNSYMSCTYTKDSPEMILGIDSPVCST